MCGVFAHIGVPRRGSWRGHRSANRWTEIGGMAAQRMTLSARPRWRTSCTVLYPAGAELRQIRVCLGKVLPQNSGFYDGAVKRGDLSWGQTVPLVGFVWTFNIYKGRAICGSLRWNFSLFIPVCVAHLSDSSYSL